MRYTVRTDVPPRLVFTMVAWVRDSTQPWAISWHESTEDAEFVCAVLNAAEQREQAERVLAVHANVMEF